MCAAASPHPSAQHGPGHWSHRGRRAKPSVYPPPSPYPGSWPGGRELCNGVIREEPQEATGSEEALTSPRDRGQGKMTGAVSQPGQPQAPQCCPLTLRYLSLHVSQLAGLGGGLVQEAGAQLQHGGCLVLDHVLLGLRQLQPQVHLDVPF